MSEWPTRTIKSTSYLKGRIGWQGLRADEFLEEGPFLITGTDFTGGKIDWSNCYHVSEKRFREAAYIHVNNGDILITKDGTIGKVALVDRCPDKAVLNSGIFLLRCADGSYNHEFVYYVLNSEIFLNFLRKYLNGSTINHLYQHVFEKFRIPLPDSTKQKKIAKILQTVDHAIEKTEALIDKYQQIKAGLMHDFFTRGIGSDGKLRPPRERAPELYQETPIGWIPREWVFGICEDVCEKIIDCKNRTPPVTPDGHPVIRTPNVRNGAFVDEGLVYTDARSYLIWTARGAPQPGDIVITREAPVGEVCKIPSRHEYACLGQRMMLYRVDREKIVSDFFLYALQSNAIQNRLDLISGGSTVGHVRVGDVRNLWIFYPESRDEQSRISSALNGISSKIDNETLVLSKLQKQKSGLMHDLLTGNVPARIKLEEELAAEIA